MNKKKFIPIIIGAAAAAGIIVFFLLLGRNGNNFPADGYILEIESNETVQESMPLVFSTGVAYKERFPASYIFKDITGKKNVVEDSSFIHYNDGSLSAFTDGIAVNMTEVEAGYMEFYYLGKNMVMTKAAEGWQIDNNSMTMDFPELLWELSEDKVMAASDEMTLYLSGKEPERISGYLEVSWPDKDIVQVANQDLMYQTVAAGGRIVYGSGVVLDFEKKAVENSDEETCFTMQEIMADMSASAITIRSESAANWKMPEFNIYNDDGKAGENGESGQSGENGRTGNMGQAGEGGEAGEVGSDGQAGTGGKTGEVGSKGSTPLTGSLGGDLELSSGIVQGSIRIYDMDYDCSTIIVDLAVDNSYGKLLMNSCIIEIYDAATGRLAGSQSYNGSEVTFWNILEPDREYVASVTCQYELDTAAGTVINTKVFDSKNFYTSSEGISMEQELVGESTVFLSLKQLSGMKTVANSFRLCVSSGEKSVDWPDYGGEDLRDYISVSNPETILLDMKSLFGADYDSNVPYRIELYTSPQDAGSYVWDRKVEYDDDGKEKISDYEGLSSGAVRKSGQILSGKTLKQKPVIGNIRYQAGSGYYDLSLNVEKDKDNSIRTYRFTISWEEGDSRTGTKVLESSTDTVRWYYGNVGYGNYTVNARVIYNDNEKDNILEASPVTIVLTGGESGISLSSETVTKNSIKGDLVVDTQGRDLKSGSSITVTVSAYSVGDKNDDTYSYWKSYSLPISGTQGSDGKYYFPSAIDCLNLRSETTYTITVQGIIVTWAYDDAGNNLEQGEVLGTVSKTTLK